MRIIIGLVIAVFFLCSGSAFAKDISRPNIVLFMVDDFGYECITANGGESYQTPNVDKLAAAGIRFEHCHVQPLCTPTRVQLMTGKYNVRNYLKFGTLMRDQITFGNLLKGAAYRTGICGKWQLGQESDSPQHFGFEESCLWQQTRRPPRYANPGLEYNGVERDFNEGQYGPTLINDFAIDFITRHRDEPFFLYYPMVLTHDPFQPTPSSTDWDATIKSEAVQKNVRHFAEMTEWMDKMVGRVIDKLQELEIRENTLVIFIGDNGTHSSIASRFRGESFKGGKGQTTHRGTHVPCIVNWPKVIRSPAISDALISSTDFLPTICAAAGIGVPSEVDGVSFLGALTGDEWDSRKWLYSWYSPRQRADLKVKECAFSREYKLYRGGEFYDLVADPDEQVRLDLASLGEQEAEAYQRLHRVLDQYRDVRPTALDDALTNGAGSGQPTAKKKKASTGSKE